MDVIHVAVERESRRVTLRANLLLTSYEKKSVYVGELG